tara:strand:+ start:3223 stop:3543 length:321 start_codon:yes stop_codon:yes gene_type:complete
MSDINWDDLSKDLVKIIDKHGTLDIKYSVKKLTWATGDSRCEASYKLITKNNSWTLTEDYSLDKDDKDDEYSLADSRLCLLKDKMSKKGYLTNLENNVLSINSKLI